MKSLLFILTIALAPRISAAEEFNQDGIWKPIAAIVGGAKMPERALKAITLKITGADYEVTVEGENEPDKGTVATDKATAPRRMTIKSTQGPNQGKTFLAIYEMKDANSMRICYDLTGTAFPTEFKAPKGTGFYLVGYRRQAIAPKTDQSSTATGEMTNWPCFRGPDRMGIAPAGNDAVPLEWSDTKNIVWKRELPGRGASSPIVWGDSIYLTAYTGYLLEKNDPYDNIHKLVRHLLCVDRRSGTIRWKADIPTEGKLYEHGLSEFGFLHGYASSTPVADASGVYIYLGKRGVFAYDHAGKERWHVLAGNKEHNWGSASSPILFENLLIVHPDVEHGALFGLDKETGREVWRAETGKGDSWSTPLIYKSGNRYELAFNHTSAHHQSDKSGTATVGAVNPRTGEALWECRMLKDYLCPSPVEKDGVIYWLSENSAAVRTGGKGDVTGSHIQWTSTRGTEVCTPIIHNGHLYWAHQENGMAYCLDLKTGTVVYNERLQPAPDRIYASGVLVGDRIYYVSRERGTYVVEAKPVFRQLGHNRIESDTSVFNGTPAVSRGQMFLRSDRFLYCVGKK